MAKLRVTAGLDELLSLVTFFAAAKKVTPAPGRGSANRPTRNRDSTKAPRKQPQSARKTIVANGGKVNAADCSLPMTRIVIRMNDPAVPRIRPAINSGIRIEHLAPAPAPRHADPISQPRHRRHVADDDELTPFGIRAPIRIHAVRVVIADDPLEAARLAVQLVQRRLARIKMVQIAHAASANRHAADRRADANAATSS